MTRFFNTAGVCEPRIHYMLPPLRRLPDVATLIDQESYFVVHAPRQSGKTTCFHHLARELTAAGRYAALLTTCETARTAGDDLDRAVGVVVRAIETDAGNDLPEEQRPPPAETVQTVSGELRLNRYLREWCRSCPRPVVLFLDEIDALVGKSLLAVLQQLVSEWLLSSRFRLHRLAGAAPATVAADAAHHSPGIGRRRARRGPGRRDSRKGRCESSWSATLKALACFDAALGPGQHRSLNRLSSKGPGKPGMR